MSNLDWLDEEVASERKIYIVNISKAELVCLKTSVSSIVNKKVREAIELHGPFYQMRYEEVNHNGAVRLILEK